MRPRLCGALLLAGLAAAALAGCGDSTPTPGDDATTLAPSTAPADPTDPAESPTDTAANVQAAIDDLADTLDVAATDIDAGPLEPVTWPDGSLGCPQAGQAYPQVLTDGYRLILTVDGAEYAYHAGEDGDLVYCADPAAPVEGGADRS